MSAGLKETRELLDAVGLLAAEITPCVRAITADGKITADEILEALKPLAITIAADRAKRDILTAGFAGITAIPSEIKSSGVLDKIDLGLHTANMIRNIAEASGVK